MAITVDEAACAQPYNEVLDYWFGQAPGDAQVIAERSALWWDKDEAVDRQIRQRFGGLVEQAANGQLESWRDAPCGLLALIVLTDQFPRNIHRDTPQAFALDPLARALCLDLVHQGMDRDLRPIERIFAWLPLEHSESAVDQASCVALMQALADAVGDELRSTFESYVEYARQHQRIIERFGRFPHRNAILGRISTAEETAFLQTPGSSF